MYFSDSLHAWAVGGNGLVLRTDNWVSWINHNTGETYPARYHLSQNYPNPFNPSTTIKFYLPQVGHVRIDIYNTTGQRVKTIINRQMTAGEHIIEFNARDLASGLYYYRIDAGKFQNVKKMVLLK